MKEFKRIVQAYRAVDTSQHQVALATVVRVHGSSYRSPGARMLITDDGNWVGSISGGCLEGDALRKARQVMHTNLPIAVTYDTREESNQNLGIGLGCNGVIDVLIEPVHNATENNPIPVLEKSITCNSPVVLATGFSGRFIGKKLLMDNHGNVLFNSFDEEPAALLRHELARLSPTHQSEVKKLTDSEVFLELILPVIHLILFGAGFDARPVSELAKSLGWNVEVTDECVAHIAPVFFPSADRLSLCKREFVEREFSVTEYTACVLMSHNYEYDRDVLRRLVQTPAPYIGILGPRKRFDKMREEFRQNGFELSAEDLHRIHSPIGLDIGAETPDEIAVSIIAEIQGKFSNRSGGFLKYRNNPIHHRDISTDQVFKQIYMESVSQTKAGNN